MNTKSISLLISGVILFSVAYFIDIYVSSKGPESCFEMNLPSLNKDDTAPRYRSDIPKPMGSDDDSFQYMTNANYLNYRREGYALASKCRNGQIQSISTAFKYTSYVLFSGAFACGLTGKKSVDITFAIGIPLVFIILGRMIANANVKTPSVQLTVGEGQMSAGATAPLSN